MAVLDLVDNIKKAIIQHSVNVIQIMSITADILESIGRDVIDSVIFVSDLTQCPLKFVFSRSIIRRYGFEKFKDFFIKRKMLFDDMSRATIGILVHLGLESLTQKYNLKLRKSESARRRVITVDDVNLVLVGKPDFEVVIGDRAYPVEVKFSTNSIDRPKFSHTVQCSLYAYLYNVDYCILLVFTADGIKMFKVDSANEQTVTLIVRDWIKRIPFFKWECENCIFQELCNDEIRGRVKSVSSVRALLDIVSSLRISLNYL